MDGTRHTPQHPLPEDLSSASETVCHFCGVSYLIHREIKRLEDEVERWRAEAKYLEGSAMREKQQRVELDELNSVIQGLYLKIKDKDEKFLIMQSEHSRQELLLASVQAELKAQGEDKKAVIEMLSNKFATFQALIRGIRLSFRELHKMKCVWQTVTRDTLCGIKSTLLDFLQNASRELGQLKEENVQVKAQLTLQKDAFKADTDRSLQNLNLKHQIDIDTQKAQLLKAHDDSIKSYVERNSKLSSEMKDLQMTAEARELDLLLQINHLQDELRKAQSTSGATVLALQSKIAELTGEIEEGKKVEESGKQDMLKALRSYREEIKQLKEERHRTIEAHQARIQQLRDSYLEKLNQAGLQQKEMQQRIIDREEDWRKERDQVVDEIKQAHDRELRELCARHEDSLSQSKLAAQDTQRKLEMQIDRLQTSSSKEISNLRAQIQDVKVVNERLRSDHEGVVSNLNKKIIQLEGELKKSVVNSVDESPAVLLKRIAELKRLSSLSDDEVSSLRARLCDSERQLDVLQETVRKECEERYELTAALAEARAELLTINRFRPSPSFVPGRTKSQPHVAPPGTSPIPLVRSSNLGSTQRQHATSQSDVSRGFLPSETSSSRDSRIRIDAAIGRQSLNKLRLSLKQSLQK